MDKKRKETNGGGVIMAEMKKDETFYTLIATFADLNSALRQLENALQQLDKLNLPEPVKRTIKDALLAFRRDNRIKQVIQQLI